MRKIILTNNAPKAVGPYSQAIEANGTLYVSGQLPVNPTDGSVPESIEAQTEQSLKNIGAILTEAGYTYKDVVKSTVLLTDMNDFAAMNAVYARFYTEQMPARVCYQVAKLPMGVKVEMNYSWLYGASFSASTELQTMASGWYENGTEVIFSCGGSIFDSITAAASANDAAVIGVDVDQSYTSDTVITSALKGIGEAAQQALTAAYGSDWANYGGKLTTMGAAEGAVGLPTDTWSLKNWTVDQYKAMFEKIVKGEISIDNDFTKLASTDHVTLNLVK